MTRSAPYHRPEVTASTDTEAFTKNAARSHVRGYRNKTNKATKSGRLDSRPADSVESKTSQSAESEFASESNKPYHHHEGSHVSHQKALMGQNSFGTGERTSPKSPTLSSDPTSDDPLSFRPFGLDSSEIRNPSCGGYQRSHGDSYGYMEHLALSKGHQTTLEGRREVDLPTYDLGIHPEHRHMSNGTNLASAASPSFELSSRPALISSSSLSSPNSLLCPSSSANDYSRLRSLMPDLKTLYEFDLPKPEPYNPAYPHPISAYASRGVNPAALAISGYDKILDHLLRYDRNKLKGSILAGAEGEDILPPALTMVMFAGEGNGIPERLWTRFESLGAARIQVGAANAGPFARVEPTSGSFVKSGSYSVASSTNLPPRFAAISAHMWTKDAMLEVEPISDSSSGPHYRYTHRDDATRLSQRSPSDASPWFKTELCSVWEDTGLCKFGKGCQYAHGLEDLRVPSKIVPLPTPPLETKLLNETSLPEGALPHAYQTATSLAIRNTPMNDRWQKSPPSRDLSGPGEKHEKSRSPFCHGDVAPIGAERKASLGITTRSSGRYPMSRSGNDEDNPTRKSLALSTSTSSSSWSDELGQSNIWNPTDRLSDPDSSYEVPSIAHKAPNGRWKMGIDMGTSARSAGKSIWT